MPSLLQEMPAESALGFLRRLDPERFENATRDELIGVAHGIQETRNSLIHRAVMAGRDDVLASAVLGYEVVPGLHDRMIAHEQQHKKSLLLAFRGSGKTTVTTVTGSIGALLRDRNVRILIASKTQSNAEDMLKEIKTQIETNETLKEIFGELIGSGRWDLSGIEVAGRTLPAKEPTINTIGVQGSAASKHYDIIHADDLVDEPNTLTPLQRQRLQDWVYKVLDPCLLPPDEECPWRGQAHYKGTRYADKDLYGYQIENEMAGERTLIIPVRGWDGASAWPARYPLAWIQEKERTLGSIRFGSQFRCDTEAMKGRIFKYDDCLQHGIDEYPDASELLFYLGVDPATGEDGSDDGAWVVIGRSPKRWHDIWVWDYFHGQVGFGAQGEKTIEFGRRYKPRRTGVEANGYQKTQFRKVRDEAPWLKVVPVTTEVSKTVRGFRLSGRFEARNVHFLRGHHHDLIQHLVDFDGKKHGKDDLFDALDIAVQVSERRGGERRVRTEEFGLL